MLFFLCYDEVLQEIRAFSFDKLFLSFCLSKGANGQRVFIVFVRHSFSYLSSSFDGNSSYNTFILFISWTKMLFPDLTLAKNWKWEGVADTVFGLCACSQSFLIKKTIPGLSVHVFFPVGVTTENWKLHTYVWRCSETDGRKQLYNIR